ELAPSALADVQPQLDDAFHADLVADGDRMLVGRPDVMADGRSADKRLGGQLAVALQVADKKIRKIRAGMEVERGSLVVFRLAARVLVVLVLAIAAGGAEPEPFVMDAAPRRE